MTAPASPSGITLDDAELATSVGAAPALQRRPALFERITNWIERVPRGLGGNHPWAARQRAINHELRQRVLQLQCRNAALKMESARQAAALAELSRVRESADAKGACLAGMSHEIRTPLNGIIGMANLLAASDLNEDQADLTRTICRCGDDLLAIVNDVLDYSKIEAGQMKLESVDFNLAEQLQPAIDLHAEAAAGKGLELVMDIDSAVPTAVRGDPLRLRQIVLNLVGNAIKFTASGEVVLRVRLDGEQSSGARLRFEVSDTGIGIPVANQARLFDDYVQAEESTSRRFGGTGLGLAICRRLVGLMGGTIGVRSAAGEGATFWFVVAVHPALAEEEQASPNRTPAVLAGRRVLVVDDNATNRQVLDRTCAGWKMNHAVAESAAAALHHLRVAAAAGSPFELVLLDHHMPGQDGLDLAGAVMADPSIGRPIMLMLTSRGERLSSAQLTAHGISGCELKPVFPHQLRQRLERLLAQPAAAARSEQTAVSPAVAPAGDILVVDDNPVCRRVAELQLRNLGRTVDAVGSGEAAIAAIARKTYALVLMDLSMPNESGLDTARRIREAQAASGVRGQRPPRILAMTAHAAPNERDTCLAAGMDDFLTKPLRVEELKAALKRLAPRP